MESPPSAEERPRSVVTWRALLVGVVCVLIVSLGAPYGTFKMKSSTMALDFSMPAAVFMMFVLAIVVGLSRFLGRGKGMLTGPEMLVVFAMMAVACGVCTMGLTGYLIPMLGAPQYYGSQAGKGWDKTIIPLMPKWIMLTRETVGGSDAIRYMYEGLPQDASRDMIWGIVRAWVRPLAYWMIFLLPLYWTSICIMAIFRKQWVEEERIIFPLVQLPMALAADPATPRSRFAAILKSKALWYGFAIPFVLACLKALPTYFPAMTALKPRTNWDVRMLEEQWRLRFFVSWQTIGLSYLLSADVSLCVWFFGFLGSFYNGLSKRFALGSNEKLGLYGAARRPDLGHFAMGAMIALVLIRLWVGRRRLAGVFRKAFFMKSDEDDRFEPMSYKTAVWGMIAGFAIMVVWLCYSGFSWPIAILILFAAFIGFIGLTRIVAESGVPVSIVPLVSSDFVVSAVGTSALGKHGIAALPWTYVWDGDCRTFVMSSAAQGLRACSGGKRSYRGLFAAMMIALVIAIVASVTITLVFAYQSGGTNMSNWFFVSGPAYPFNFAKSLMKPRPPDLRGWLATGVGAAAMVGLTMARRSFIWWPLNPVGLPIAPVDWTQHLWFSIFLAWLIKTRFIKYGGPRLYTRLRPFFLGLVLGEYTGAVFWMIIGAITDEANRTFWI